MERINCPKCKIPLDNTISALGYHIEERPNCLVFIIAKLARENITFKVNNEL